VNGVVRTDKWLESNIENPKKICELLTEYFQGETNAQKIYDYLLNFGMYKPTRRCKKNYEILMERKQWSKIEKLFLKYKRKWEGPDIPIFIFPMNEGNVRLMKEGKGKSGVSFKDKLFIFLTPIEDEKEIEALFVHEYHHVCRMNCQQKEPADYTLLDSIILEGLAEHAVAMNCGDRYTGDWSRRYSTEELEKFWKNGLSEKLSITRKDKMHDQLLFGLGGSPRLLGYALGYEIVKQYKQRENFTEKASFNIPSTSFTKLLNF
jgi:uncharacterized protein YjaZ